MPCVHGASEAWHAEGSILEFDLRANVIEVNDVELICRHLAE